MYIYMYNTYIYIYIYIYRYIIPLPETKVSCNLRRNDTFEMRQVHSVYHCAESIFF